MVNEDKLRPKSEMSSRSVSSTSLNSVDAHDSLDDDSDFDEDLNLGELDNVLDQMSAIKSFLRNIGFSNELPLLGLANRLMAIKDEEKAIEAIMQCLEESRIQTNENKRASIIANFRTLQQWGFDYMKGRKRERKLNNS